MLFLLPLTAYRLPLAHGQAPQGVEIFFVPNSTRSITVSLSAGATFYSFGSILVGSAAVSNVPIEITNDGNVAATASVQVSSPAVDLGLGPTGQPLNQHWALSSSSAPGVDAFALFAVFQSSQPGNGQYAGVNHVLSDAPACASATRFAGGQTGLRIPAADTPAGNDQVKLWLNLFPPTRSSNLKPKKINVTITAGGCD